MRRIKDILVWVYWYPFRFFIQKIPAVAAYSIAKIFAVLLYYTAGGMRQRLDRELLLIPGIAQGAETMKAVRNALIILCRNEVDVLLFSELNSGNIGRFVACKGLEHLDAALAKGKGAMLLFAHFGANQMIMPAVGYRGYTMSQMSAPATVWVEKLPNRSFSRMEKKALEFRWAQEMALPVTHINIFGSLKKAFLCLKRNEVLGVAIDGGGGRSRVIVDFLGRKAFFSTGAIEIAIRTDCVVLPTFMVRNYSGKSKMIIESPLEIDTSIQTQDAIEKYIFAFTKRLEEYVYRYPCHYSNFLALRTFMEKQGDIPFFIKENNSESITGQAAVS